MKTKSQNKSLSELPETFVPFATELNAGMVAGLPDVSPDELRDYCQTHPAADDVSEIRRRMCAELVESALLRRATGYEDANGKEVPPDVRAAVFWLQHRCPEKWRRTGSTGSGNPEIELSREESGL